MSVPYPSRRSLLRAGALATAGVVASCAPEKPTDEPQRVTRVGRARSASVAAPPTARKVWTRLAVGNARYAAGHQESPQEVSQVPSACVLACSEMRTPPEVLFDAALGDLVVVRSAACVLGSNLVGSIEHAVSEFELRLVLVLGHSNCRIVRSAIDIVDGGEAPEGRIEKVLGVVAKSVERTPRMITNFAAGCVATHTVRMSAKLNGRSDLVNLPRDGAGTKGAEVVPLMYEPGSRLIRRLHGSRPWRL